MLHSNRLEQIKLSKTGIFNDNPFPNLHCPAAAAAKSLQSCPTLCDPRDGSLPGSSVPGILQAKFAYLCQYYNDLTTGALK